MGCWDTSAAQPRLKRKHPFLPSFSCSSSPPTSQLEAALLHSMLHVCLPPAWCLTPYYRRPPLLSPPAVADPPSLKLDKPNWEHLVKACCVHIIFSLAAQMQMTVTAPVIGKSWPSRAVCFDSLLKQDCGKKKTKQRQGLFFCLVPLLINSRLYRPEIPQWETRHTLTETFAKWLLAICEKEETAIGLQHSDSGRRREVRKIA